MVFELSDSLISDRILNDPVLKDSLHNLFLGYAEGNLLLSVSPRLLDFLAEGLDDDFSKRVINHLQNRVFVHYDVLWQTIIVLDNPRYENHELAIDFFRKTSTIQPPILLCENLDDTKFYFALCREYFGINFINTKNGQGAGGSSLADNLENIVNNQDRFCLCIVDSDIKYPNCDDGGTYVAILNKNLVPHPSFEVYKLNVHEIENLIPIDIISKNTNDNNKRKFANRLKEIDNDGDILKYYDIKEGIKLASIRFCPEYFKFAKDIFDRFANHSGKKSFDSYLTSLSRKKSGQVFSQICPGILVKFLSLDTRFKDRFIYCDYLRNEWNNIKELVVTFFCAREDTPIN